MRIYARDQVCGFRFRRAAWGAFSNFQPLPAPIAAGPWTFATSESLYQACKFAGRPDVQQRIAEAPTAREAAAIGRTPGLGIDPGWNAQRVDVMRWVLRLKREANEAEIDALLAATGDRPIVEVSARDPGGEQSQSPGATRATTSSAGCGWNCASSFATETRPPAPVPGSTASASAASPPPSLRKRPRRAADRRCAARPIGDRHRARRLKVWSAALL